MDLSIIIPTFNELDNIKRLAIKIKQILVNEGVKYELIIIDDNSPDKTGQVLKTIEDKINARVYIRKDKKELGSAILLGINKARGDVIIGMDADFNHPPEMINQLLKGLLSADMIIGSRFIKGGAMDNEFRYYLTYLFNLIIKTVLQIPVYDNTSGMYAIKRSKLFCLPINQIYQGYGEYHIRLVWYAHKAKMTIKEIPIIYQKRQYGKSKSNFIKMLFDYLTTCVFLKFNNYGHQRKMVIK